MEYAKPLTQSLTLKGLLVAVILYACQQFGLDLDEGFITEFILTLGNLIALIIAGYGRIRAKTKLAQ